VPRKVKVKYEEAIYHMMNCGDRRETIFTDDTDREIFLTALGESCAKTDSQVHALCLLSNHFIWWWKLRNDNYSSPCVEFTLLALAKNR
jgi:REP element-mobilizing transposase RayT